MVVGFRKLQPTGQSYAGPLGSGIFRPLWEESCLGFFVRESISGERFPARPPNRIDLLNQIDGVHFDDAWPHRKKVELEAEPSPIPINYLDLENLIKNKEASARPKDLDDLKYLKSSKKSD